MKNKSSNLADKLFPDVSEVQHEILDIPPDKRKLNTETYDFTVSTINDYIKEGHIQIPEFQRGYVWNRSQASRLIESLIIQCPIPVVFLSQNSDETLSVIDGNQRLNTINLYLEEDFALQGLTAYPELDGFRFSELDPRFQRHIKNRTIRCIVILKDTHPQIKFDVFERLNTGSVKLNAQELRHGIHFGPLMELLETLAKNKDFKEFSGYKQDKRMRNEELILRFFALADNWRNYQKPLSGFLNTFSEKNRDIDEGRVDILKGQFVETFNICRRLFGSVTFRSFSEEGQKPKFNAALFDAQMIAVYESDLRQMNIERILGSNINHRLSELYQEEEFSRWISQATTDRNSVQGRIRRFTSFLSSISQ